MPIKIYMEVIGCHHWSDELYELSLKNVKVNELSEGNVKQFFCFVNNFFEIYNWINLKKRKIINILDLKNLLFKSNRGNSFRRWITALDNRIADMKYN